MSADGTDAGDAAASATPWQRLKAACGAALASPAGQRLVAAARHESQRFLGGLTAAAADELARRLGGGGGGGGGDAVASGEGERPHDSNSFRVIDASFTRVDPVQ